MTPELDFPKELPPFLREGYGFNHVQPFTRTEMVTGRARQRRTFQNVPSILPVSILLSDSEAQLFESWFAYDADDGTKWFNATIKTPEGLMPYACRFISMYEGPELWGSCHWKFRMQLEVFKRPIISQEWYEWHKYSREFILYADIFDQAMNREWPEWYEYGRFGQNADIFDRTVNREWPEA